MWKKNTGHGPFWRKQQESKQGKAPQRGMSTQDWEKFLNGEVFNEEKIQEQRLDADKVVDMYEGNAPGSQFPEPKNKLSLNSEVTPSTNEMAGNDLQKDLQSLVDAYTDPERPKKPGGWDNRQVFDMEVFHHVIGAWAFKKYMKERADREYDMCMTQDGSSPDACQKWKSFSEDYSYTQGMSDNFFYNHHKKDEAWEYYKWYLDRLDPEQLSRLHQDIQQYYFPKKQKQQTILH